eukprot:scaffold1077_cov253-Pinguiococcus_pyrenoidosus.AAC.5
MKPKPSGQEKAVCSCSNTVDQWIPAADALLGWEGAACGAQADANRTSGPERRRRSRLSRLFRKLSWRCFGRFCPFRRCFAPTFSPGEVCALEQRRSRRGGGFER